MVYDSVVFMWCPLLDNIDNPGRKGDIRYVNRKRWLYTNAGSKENSRYIQKVKCPSLFITRPRDSISAPLCTLTRKDAQWEWGPDQAAALRTASPVTPPCHILIQIKKQS